MVRVKTFQSILPALTNLPVFWNGARPQQGTNKRENLLKYCKNGFFRLGYYSPMLIGHFTFEKRYAVLSDFKISSKKGEILLMDVKSSYFKTNLHSTSS